MSVATELTKPTARVVILAAAAYESRIERRAYAESLVLSLDELPAEWELQTTVDLTNWFSVIRSGELAPTTITIHLAGSNAAQYYRLR